MKDDIAIIKLCKDRNLSWVFNYTCSLLSPAITPTSTVILTSTPTVTLSSTQYVESAENIYTSDSISNIKSIDYCYSTLLSFLKSFTNSMSVIFDSILNTKTEQKSNVFYYAPNKSYIDISNSPAESNSD